MPSRSRKSKKKTNNTADDATLGVNERILNEVKKIYVGREGEIAIEEIARNMGEDILHPRNKVTVMIIGNHSSGKSSFINWYCDEAVCRTGVAIESRGFTICTYGKRPSAPIKGEGTLRYFPHIKGLRNFDGVMDRFQTVTSVSNVRNFPMVDFMDTPGLVGGREKAQKGAYSGVGYSFDVNEVMLFLADHVDLIFVFLDPIGQALCTRTMDVVEALNKRHYMKMKYYLTKADEIDSPTDLMKVTSQVTQNLAHRVSNNHGFEVPSIFLPNGEASEDMAKFNNIGKLCAEIDRTIEQKVQVNLDRLREDSKRLLKIVSSEITKETFMRTDSRSKYFRATCFGVLAWFVIPLVACFLMIGALKPYLPSELSGHEMMIHVEAPSRFLFQVFPSATMLHIVGTLLVMFCTLLLVQAFYRCRASRHKMRPETELAKLRKYEAYLSGAIKSRDMLHEKMVSQHVHKD